MKIRDLMSFTTKSIPSKRPEPVTALQAIMLQCLPSAAILSRSSTSRISLGVSAPATSCLLQKTKRVAPASFS